MSKVKAGTSRLTSTGMVEKGYTVVRMMKNNPDYVNEQELLPALEEACEKAAAANEAAHFNGGKLEHDVKRKCQVALRKLINAMVPHVQTASGGDSEKIIGAGFDVVKKPEPLPAPPQPHNFQSVYTPMEGDIKFRWSIEREARYYQLYVIRADGSRELMATTTRTVHTLHGLKSGDEYTFKVVAVGAAGPSAASDAVTAKAS